MSNDGRYLLLYDPFASFLKQDMEYISSKYGDIAKIVARNVVYCEMNKYLLLPEDIRNLGAEQILAYEDSESYWKIIR